LNVINPDDHIARELLSAVAEEVSFDRRTGRGAAAGV